MVQIVNYQAIRSSVDENKCPGMRDDEIDLLTQAIIGYGEDEVSAGIVISGLIGKLIDGELKTKIREVLSNKSK